MASVTNEILQVTPPGMICRTACNITAWPMTIAMELTFSNRVAGQVEVMAGQVSIRGSLLCFASNVLEPMLEYG